MTTGKDPVALCCEKQRRERDDQLDADIRTVLGTPAGRRLLVAALAKCGVWGVLGHADGNAVRLAHAAGRRDAAAAMLGHANRAAAGQVSAALAEHNARVEDWNRQLEKAREEKLKGQGVTE